MKKTISFDKEIEFSTMIGEITSISLDHTLKFVDSSNVEGSFFVSGTYKMTEASQLEEDFNYAIPVEIALAETYDLATSKVEIEDFYYEVMNDEVLKCKIDVLIEGVEEIKLEEEPEVLEEQAASDLMREAYQTAEEEPLAEDVRGNEDAKSVEPMEEAKQLDLLEIPDLTKVEAVSKDCDEDVVIEEVCRDCDGDVKKEEEKEIPVKKESVKTECDKTEIEEVEEDKIRDDNQVGSLFSTFKDADETFSTYIVYIMRKNDTVDGILDRYQISREELCNYNDLDNLELGSKIIIPAIKDE